MVLVHTVYTSGLRSVAILVRNQPPFPISITRVDQQGRYMGVHGTWSKKYITVINVYAPPIVQQPVYDQVVAILL